MKRRGCKEVGGIHWHEMIAKEGIDLRKRTGELVGFEHLTINSETSVHSDPIFYKQKTAEWFNVRKGENQ